MAQMIDVSLRPGKDPPRPSSFLKSLSGESLHCALSRESTTQPPPTSPSPTRKPPRDPEARGRGRRMRGRGSQRPPRSRGRSGLGGAHRTSCTPREALFCPRGFSPLKGFAAFRRSVEVAEGLPGPPWAGKSAALAWDTASPQRPPAAAWARGDARASNP